MSASLRFPWVLLAAASGLGVAAVRSASIGGPDPAPMATLEWRSIHERKERGPSKVGLLVANVAAREHTIFAVGPDLTFRSDDDGATWSELPKLPRAIRAAFGKGGLILIPNVQGKVNRSADGGATWTTVGTPARARLLSIALFDDDVALAGGDSTLLSSSDRGSTWRSIPIPAITIYGIATRGRTAVAVGGVGYVTRTTDGGATWTPQWLPVQQLAMTVAFADENTLVIVGSGGMIMRSTDGGEHWSRVPTPTKQNLRSVAFRDARHGMAVGYWGEALVTQDAGATWTRERTGTDAHLMGVTATSTGAYIAVGLRETILRAEAR